MISTIGEIFRRYLSPGALTVRLTDRSHEALDVWASRRLERSEAVERLKLLERPSL